MRGATAARFTWYGFQEGVSDVQAVTEERPTQSARPRTISPPSTLQGQRSVVTYGVWVWNFINAWMAPTWMKKQAAS